MAKIYENLVNGIDIIKFVNKKEKGKGFCNVEIDNRVFDARSKLLAHYRRSRMWQDDNYIAYDRFSDKKGYKWFLNRLSTKCFRGFGLPDTLTWAERGRVTELAAHMTYGNLLFYRSDGDKKPLTPDKMAEFLGMSSRGIHRFLCMLERENIIAKQYIYIDGERYTAYYLNPIYFFAGKWLSPQLYLLFKRDLDRYLPTWVTDRFALVISQQQRQAQAQDTGMDTGAGKDAGTDGEAGGQAQVQG